MTDSIFAAGEAAPANNPVRPVTFDTPFTVTQAPGPIAADQPAAAPAVKATDLSPLQRRVLLLRAARAVKAERKPVLPAGIDLRAFLQLFSNDTTVDPQCSTALHLVQDADRRAISRIIADACKLFSREDGAHHETT